jgi:toxin YoeB
MRRAPVPPGRRQERETVFDSSFFEDLQYWIKTRPNTAARLLELVEAARRDPFRGIGKPEPLRHLGPNHWSRRLTQEHRMVYVVQDDRITFSQGRYHY